MLRLPPAPPAPERTSDEGLAAGLRYAWGHSVVRPSLLLCGATTITSAAPIVLGPFVADGIFHRGSTGLGILLATFGVGATLGVADLARRTNSDGLGRVAGLGALLYGVAVIGYGLSPTFWLTVLFSFGAGFFVFRQNASNNTLIQSVIEERYRGRVMSFYTMMAVGMLPIGSVAAGWSAERWGPRPVLCAAGILAIVSGGWFLRYTRRMEFRKWVAG